MDSDMRPGEIYLDLQTTIGKLALNFKLTQG